MKTICLILFLGMNLQVVAQLNEHFSDGNFTSSPSWNGDVHAWRIDGQRRLNTKDTAVSQSVYLYTTLPNSKNAKWDFLLQMNFNPSSSNRIRIYLFSDQPGLKGPLNGYFLQIGESGTSDSYDLYRQDSLAVTRILEGPEVKRSEEDTLVCRFRISKDQAGNWELFADSTGAKDFISYGRAWDNTYREGKYVGLLATYTPSRSGKFFFDDLQVMPLENDTLNPPPFIPEYGDIIINEVFADPVPSAGLPVAEFVELYNTTDTVIYLRNWTWKDKNSDSRFENDSIAPGEYLIVCHSGDTAGFSGSGRTVGISPFPILNNSGDALQLISPYGQLIDSLSYRADWYRDAKKKKGGWSLERIAPSLPCFPEANWAASLSSSGGTPGRKNSLAGEFEKVPFTLQHFEIKDSLHLKLYFSSFPEPASVLEAGSYLLNNGASVHSVQFADDIKAVILHLEQPLQRGMLYRLSLKNIRDCYGNPVTKGREKEFLLPEQAALGDVIINEILFNPRPGGTDFVEIYNCSDKILDLSAFSLASADQQDSLSGIAALSDSTALLYPGEYRLLSQQPETVKAQYFTRSPDAFLEMERFPAFNNESGSCLLLGGETRIDRFDYHEDMHFELITDPEGVSLEKTHFDLPASRPGAFRSAAAAAGYGTPGYRNSQFSRKGVNINQLSVANRLFSPDNDGLNDLLEIRFQFWESNLVANIRIFDINGCLVKRLANNMTLGTSGRLTWDGKDESGSGLRVGMYLILAEVFSTKGQTMNFRETCILTP